jgi:hypothetical protein
VARVGEATREDKRSRGREGETRGGVLQLEVALGWPAPAVSGGGSAEQTGSGAARGGRSRRLSEGLFCEIQRFQGPHCNLKFSHCYKGQMEKRLT